jgi:drug/metabolite transporter (DMT)-like permease
MQNLILYAVCVLIWGSTWYVQKFQIGAVDPVLSVAYRFGLTTLLMAGYALAAGKLKNLNFTPRQHGFIALQGFFLFFLNYWFFYLSTHYLTSGLVAVCFATLSVMNSLNQRIFFGTPFRRQAVIASALGLAGIILVFRHEVEQLSLSDPRMIGIGLALLGAYTASIGNIASMRNSRDKMPVFPTVTIGMAWGTASAFILALALGTPFTFDPSFHYLASLIYLVVLGSVVAFLSYLTLIARIGADRAGYVGIVLPVIALTISTFFENYIWTLSAVAGIALIVAGNIMALKKEKQ